MYKSRNYIGLCTFNLDFPGTMLDQDQMYICALWTSRIYRSGRLAGPVCKQWISRFCGAGGFVEYAVVGKVTVMKLLHYVTSYFVK